MLAARVEPKNGDLEEDGEAGGGVCASQQSTVPLCRITDSAGPSYDVVGIPVIQLVPYSCVTTDHACALSGFAKSGAGGFVLVSAEALDVMSVFRARHASWRGHARRFHRILLRKR
jgi:hypothetical protein